MENLKELSKEQLLAMLAEKDARIAALEEQAAPMQNSPKLVQQGQAFAAAYDKDTYNEYLIEIVAAIGASPFMDSEQKEIATNVLFCYRDLGRAGTKIESTTFNTVKPKKPGWKLGRKRKESHNV